MLSIKYEGQAHQVYRNLPVRIQHRLNKHIHETIEQQNHRSWPWLKALGHHKPPETILVGGQPFHQVRIFKHAAWSAVALYANQDKKLMCRFNRSASFLGLPLAWLGRYMTRRERKILARLKGIPHCPQDEGDVFCHHDFQDNAVAFSYIEGWPLNFRTSMDPVVYQRLEAALEALHNQHMAHLDIHSRNILISDANEPYLIDLQTCFMMPKNWIGQSQLSQKLLRTLQASDRRRLDKIIHKFHHSAQTKPKKIHKKPRPLIIKLYRLLRKTIKTFRKYILKPIKYPKKRSFHYKLPQCQELPVDEYSIQYYVEPEEQKIVITQLREWRPNPPEPPFKKGGTYSNPPLKKGD